MGGGVTEGQSQKEKVRERQPSGEAIQFPVLDLANQAVS